MRRNKKSIKEIVNLCWPTPPQHEMEADCDEVWKRLEAELDQHDTSLWSLEGDGWSALPVNQREFQVLTAASTLGERASLASITELVDNWTQREMVGHVYVTLGRLAERGLMKVQSDPPRPYEEPQYRIKLTEDGERALRRAKLEGKELVTGPNDQLDGLCPERSGLFNDKS